MDMPEFNHTPLLNGASFPSTHALLSISDEESIPFGVKAMMVVPADFTVREVLMAMQNAGYTMSIHCQIVKYDLSGLLPGESYVPYIKVIDYQG